MQKPASYMLNCLEVVWYFVPIANATCGVPIVVENSVSVAASLIQGTYMAKVAYSWKDRR
jgi:hypothetical protein